MIRQTQADDGIWTFEYVGPVGAHTSVTVTDPRGHATIHRMNPGGFASETLDALGQVTSQERDAAGRVVATTDPLGRVTRFTYDTQGNVTTITDPLQNARRFTYEPTFNRLTSITAPPIPGSPPSVTTFEYDAQGNLTAITDPEQNLRPEPDRRKTRITYNAVGQPLTITDPLENTTRFTYDPVGDLVAVADPLGNTTTREYDAVSRLTRQLDPRGKPATFTYDALNRITDLIDSLGASTRFSYDGNGNLLTVTDARESLTQHTYDGMDRLATRTDPVQAVESFVYDPAGNLIRHTDRKQQLATFSYDGLNRRTGGSYADGSATSFVYDAGGRLIQASDSVGGTILNQYDLLDRLLAHATGLGTVSYQYDALRRRTRMDPPGQASVFYSYDPASRLRTITQAPLDPVTIEYDAAGRRSRLTLPNQVSTEYQYDAVSRLTALIYRNALGPLGDLTYQYDKTGNRTRVGGSFARTLLPDPIDGATYDAANRQLQFADKQMTFDANGNLTGDGANTYTWNPRNRLTALASSSATATFAYDPQGRRHAKTVNGAATHYLHDGLDVVTELTETLAVPYLRTLAIDEALGRGVSEFYLADALGSTAALTSQDGTVTTAYTYAPFGTTVVDGPASLNPFQFTGRENDGTGLYYYRARYYHPGLGRFISEDPLGLRLYLARSNRFARADSRNVDGYVYAHNNPLKFVDPSGLLYFAARAYTTDYFVVLHLDDDSWSVTFKGVYEIRNAPCIFMCFFADEVWDNLSRAGHAISAGLGEPHLPPPLSAADEIPDWGRGRK